MSTQQSTTASTAVPSFDRGSYFENHDTDCPEVRGMVVLESESLPAYEGVRVAEKDTDAGLWRRYWMDAHDLRDAQQDGLAEHSTTLPEEMVEDIEAKCEMSDLRRRS